MSPAEEAERARVSAAFYRLGACEARLDTLLRALRLAAEVDAAAPDAAALVLHHVRDAIRFHDANPLPPVPGMPSILEPTPKEAAS